VADAGRGGTALDVQREDVLAKNDDGGEIIRAIYPQDRGRRAKHNGMTAKVIIFGLTILCSHIIHTDFSKV
jgi:hypothetical protein